MAQVTRVLAPGWRLVFRQITSGTDQRCVIAAVLPAPDAASSHAISGLATPDPALRLDVPEPAPAGPTQGALFAAPEPEPAPEPAAPQAGWSRDWDVASWPPERVRELVDGSRRAIAQAFPAPPAGRDGL